MSCEFSPKPAARRYRREMLSAGAIYMAVVVVSVGVIKHQAPPQWLVIALALAPLAPAIFMVRAYLKFFASMDEFQRRIQTDALLVTLGVVGLGAFSYGFLEELAGFPHLPLIWVFPAMMVVWSLAQIAVRRRYK